MIDPAGVVAAGPEFDAMHLVALIKEDFREVTAVLTVDAGDKDCLR